MFFISIAAFGMNSGPTLKVTLESSAPAAHPTAIVEISNSTPHPLRFLRYPDPVLQASHSFQVALQRRIGMRWVPLEANVRVISEKAAHPFEEVTLAPKEKWSVNLPLAEVLVDSRGHAFSFTSGRYRLTVRWRARAGDPQWGSKPVEFRIP
ncbi:MAG: hypothetical protein AB7P04_11915 [Bacteriovoracia bacterium]